MKEQVRGYIERYKSIVNMFIFMIGYLAAFRWLEQRRIRHYHVIHFVLDDSIPFCEYFIIPYLLWFLFVAFTVLYIGIVNQDEGRRMGNFLMIGMTVFIIVSTIYPNIQHLRPHTFVRDNVFVDMVRFLYRGDTPTNILPSIHVFNSIGVMIALYRDERCKRHKVIQGALMLLGVSIILATMFLKQHSMIDVFSAFALSGVTYILCYRQEFQPHTAREVSPARISK